MALLVSGRRGGGGQESGNKLRHGLADHQCHRLLQVRLAALRSVMPFIFQLLFVPLLFLAHSIDFYCSCSVCWILAVSRELWKCSAPARHIARPRMRKKEKRVAIVVIITGKLQASCTVLVFYLQKVTSVIRSLPYPAIRTIFVRHS